MARLTATYSRFRSIEWTTRRVMVAVAFVAVFALPFGAAPSALVLKIWWR